MQVVVQGVRYRRLLESPVAFVFRQADGRSTPPGLPAYAEFGPVPGLSWRVEVPAGAAVGVGRDGLAVLLWRRAGEDADRESLPHQVLFSALAGRSGFRMVEGDNSWG